MPIATVDVTYAEYVSPYFKKEFVMIKFGLILAVTLSFCFAMSAANTAYANDLAEKWTQSRQVANGLGDAAKVGDKAAFTALSELASLGNSGPAMHNMGWLLDNGFYVEKDKQAACDWYKKSAGLTDYPPSMHGYALCLFRASKDWINDENAVQGRELMYDAYLMGWTQSAIFLSEKILNYPLLGREDALQASSIAEGGLLITRPTPDEFSSLQYLIGVATILGPRDLDQYRKGHAAMSLAISSGHPLAAKEMTKLEHLWMSRVVAKTNKLDAYEDSAAKNMIEGCYQHLTDKDTRMSVVNFCKDVSEIELNNVTNLSEDADYLSSMLMGEDGKMIRAAQQRLEVKAGPYRRAKIGWEIRFIPKYEARIKQEAN